MTAAPLLLAAADFDADGRDDLVVAQGTQANVRALFANADGTFTVGPLLAVGALPSALAARDVTGDLLPEIVVTNEASDSISVLPNSGSRTFATAVAIDVGLRPASALGADFDGDGRYDLATAGGGIWVATNSTPSHVRRADGNGDGRVTAADLVTLARQLGGATRRRVEDIRRRDPSATAGVDANGDGHIDGLDASAAAAHLFEGS